MFIDALLTIGFTLYTCDGITTLGIVIRGVDVLKVKLLDIAESEF